nr:hypothetical protein [Blautia sp. AF34-10]
MCIHFSCRNARGGSTGEDILLPARRQRGDRKRRSNRHAVSFFENTMAELLALAGEGTELALRRCLASSRMLSSDVSAAFDPLYAAAFEKKNAAFFGKGIVINKFTGAGGKSGSNDANAEYVGALRAIFDDAKVNWQTAELGKVDVGGGGTIAYIMSLYGMEVIDSGVPVLSMHVHGK